MEPGELGYLAESRHVGTPDVWLPQRNDPILGSWGAMALVMGEFYGNVSVGTEADHHCRAQSRGCNAKRDEAQERHRLGRCPPMGWNEYPLFLRHQKQFNLSLRCLNEKIP